MAALAAGQFFAQTRRKDQTIPVPSALWDSMMRDQKARMNVIWQDNWSPGA
jgi:hypothetical protein